MGWLERLSPRWQWLVVMSMALAVAGYNVARTWRCDALSGCVSNYWVTFWLIAYEDGYERRALIGQLMRWAFGTQLPYQAMNALAILAAAGLWATCLTLLMKRTSGKSDLSRAVLMAVLMAGPSTTVLAEVLGDPLQAACLLTVGYLVAASHLRHAMLSLALAAVTGVLATLAHEAALFMCVPVIALGWCWSQQRQLKHAQLLAVMALGLALVMAFNHQPTHGEGARLVTMTGGLLPPPHEALPGFKQLLQAEWQEYFGSAKGPLLLAWKVVRSLAWPLALVLGLCQLMQAWPVARLFAWLLALSLPLYVIAHDWGRFVVYTLWMTVALYAVHGARQPLSLPWQIGRLTGRIEAWTQALLPHAPVLLVMVVVFKPYDGYRIWGMSDKRAVMLLGAAALALAALRIKASRASRA